MSFSQNRAVTHFSPENNRVWSLKWGESGFEDCEYVSSVRATGQRPALPDRGASRGRARETLPAAGRIRVRRLRSRDRRARLAAAARALNFQSDLNKMPVFDPIVRAMSDLSGLPRFKSIDPARIETMLRQLLDENRTELTRLLARDPQRWDDLVVPIERMHHRLARFWSPVSHLNSVLNSPELRAAYNATAGRMMTVTLRNGVAEYA